jgi:hypothetical protein
VPIPHDIQAAAGATTMLDVFCYHVVLYRFV